MKKNWLFTIFMVIMLSLSNAQNVEKELLFKIGNNEVILHNECRFNVKCDKVSICVVTQAAKDEYYIYLNKDKLGPFKSITEAEAKCGSIEDLGVVSSLFVTHPISDHSQFVKWSAPDGKNLEAKIEFAGKTYGPYKIVYNFQVSPDKTKFIASVKTKDNKYQIISNFSDVINFEGEFYAEYFHFSPTGKQAMIVATEVINKEDDTQETVDYSKMTNEEIMKYLQKMEEKYRFTQEVKYYVYLTTGKKFGPYSSSVVYHHNPAYTKTGGDNWILIENNVLFVNGQRIHDFTPVGARPDGVWLSSDGKKWALATYDKLLFSDGSEYEFPILVNYCETQPDVITWLRFENNTDFVKYSRKF